VADRLTGTGAESDTEEGGPDLSKTAPVKDPPGLRRLAHFSRAASIGVTATDATVEVFGGVKTAGLSMRSSRSSSISAARERGGVGTVADKPGAAEVSDTERNAGKDENLLSGAGAGASRAPLASGSSVKVLRIEARISSIDASGELIRRVPFRVVCSTRR